MSTIPRRRCRRSAPCSRSSPSRRGRGSRGRGGRGRRGRGRRGSAEGESAGEAAGDESASTEDCEFTWPRTPGSRPRSAAPCRVLSRARTFHVRAPRVLAWLAARERGAAAPRPGEPLRCLSSAARDSSSSLDPFVVGLGNPGREHARNRHNVGLMVVDELASRHGGGFKAKFSGQPAEVRGWRTSTRAVEARALHEPVWPVGRAGRSVLQGHA